MLRIAMRFLAVAALVVACDAPPPPPEDSTASPDSGNDSPEDRRGQAHQEPPAAPSAAEIEERIAAHYAALKELPKPDDVSHPDGRITISEQPARKSAPASDLQAVGEGRCPTCRGPLARKDLPASGGYSEIRVTAHYCLPCRRYWVEQVGGAFEGTHTEWYGAFGPIER